MDVSSAIPAGEAFVTSFSDMTRLMVGQSRALARKVSLAQLLEDGGDHDGDTSNHKNDNSDGNNSGGKYNKENSRSNDSSSSRSSRVATNTNTKHSGLSEHTDSSSSSNNNNNNNNGAAVPVGTNKARAKVVQDLRSLDAIVLDLERRAASMRDAIDRQRRGNEAFRELSEATRRQTAQLAAACASLPEHLPYDGPTATAAVAVATTARAGSDAERGDPPSSAPAASTAAVDAVGARTTTVVGATAAAAGHSDGHASRVAASALPVVPVLELVTVGELEGVPRSTRSRLTIAHINAAVTEIQKAMERR